FPVVGIGASAGGLTAFKTLLKAIPEDSGMAYVLVQHLSPDHESMLPEILQKSTSIPVQAISDEIKIEPDHIYVMPANKTMVAKDGVLLLTPRPKSSKSEYRLPIDRFFKSLAEVYQDQAIGVILSGTATDGTTGLTAINNSGGITIAQDPESAAYPDMPKNAIDAKVVHFILSPDKIPTKLLELTGIINSPHQQSEKLSPVNKQIYTQILSLLRDQKGTDFTYYKQTTIRRRILRRMAINKIKSVPDYFDYVKNHKKEQDLLYQDFLIPVTSFFRNPKSFKELKKTFLPRIYENKPEGNTIRVWIAGCSTGQEAYSLAICFKEFLDKRSSTGIDKRVQIFATDLSKPAIHSARRGTYTDLEVANLSNKQLTEHFTNIKGEYQVNKSLRDLCVFANHNFLKDPPFGKIDLISCRNVLIYMEPYLQKKALSAFHYALNTNGFLMLGNSETTNTTPNLFTIEAQNEKIYSRNDVPNEFVQVPSPGSTYLSKQNSRPLNTENRTTDFEKTADKLILTRYTPSGVVINENMTVVQFRGSTKHYLEQPSGKPSHNLMDLAKPGLAFELRSLVHNAKKNNAPAIKQNIPVTIEDRLQTVSIEAVPLPNTVEPFYMILFHERDLDKGEKSAKSIKSSENDEKDLRIQQLEQELIDVRENMRSVTEEQEVQNEELQSANEELQSSSEELQSLNEELETSKEELQSTNEELTVVNQEMASLNEELEAERNYSESIVANLREPLLVLDKNLRIQSANNAFYRVFKFEGEEVKNSLIYELGKNEWEIPKLRSLLTDIIHKKSVVNDYEITHTFKGLGVVIMLINARKVITDHESKELLLLSIEDITEKVQEKRKREEIQQRYTQELEEKVEERTQELKLTNEELLQRNEDLEKMNKELEAFAYVSSHDLQEPLRKIQTIASRIHEKETGNLSDKGKNYFSMMQDSANRMQSLIQDLLNFSRLTTAERTFETVDLKKIIESVKDSFKEILKEENAQIEVTQGCETNVIVFQFHQLMNNLISNALKFSHPDRPPKIVIHCEVKKGGQLEPTSLLPQKEYCHITVTDNGIGFEEEFNEKIFEVFQKLHTKEEYPGTGIGLATVKKIV
ncbi:MAG: chemotaxis protein CheB, partial [Brumimicrobium sp.]